MRAFAAMSVVLVLSRCPSPQVTSFDPPPTRFTTFHMEAGTIDPAGCPTAVPPSRPLPAAPASARVLVGYRDWRNTATQNGVPCTTSRAMRFQSVVDFDMSAVAANLSTSHQTLTGTLTYDVVSSVQVPPGATGGLDLCVSSLRLADQSPSQGGYPAISFLTQGGFPASSPPSLGALTLPTSAPTGTLTSSGAGTVDTRVSPPTVSVDITLLLSDWAAAKRPSMGIVLVPRGPTLASMGIGNQPPTPVPPDRATADCLSTLGNVRLRVNVGR